MIYIVVLKNKKQMLSWKETLQFELSLSRMSFKIQQP